MRAIETSPVDSGGMKKCQRKKVNRDMKYWEDGRLRFLATSLLWLVMIGSNANAGIIYNLNNFPGDQDGSTLSGHITVVDTAALDGLLDPSEIISWAFTLSNPSLPTLTVDSLVVPHPSLGMSGTFLHIDANHISLPPAPVVFQTNIFGISEINASSTGYFGLIDWRRSIPGVGESYIARNGKGTPTLADDDVYWERTYLAGDPPTTLGGANPWHIATISAVPEPPSFALISVSLGMLLFVRLPILLRRRFFKHKNAKLILNDTKIETEDGAVYPLSYE